MKFPDTIVYPLNCFEELYKLHQEKESELTLGVFPTSNSKKLGPVIINDENKVLLIEDKPENPLANNTWNILIWEDKFLDLLLNEVRSYREKQCTDELLIFDIFNKVIQQGYNMNACIYPI